MIEYRVDNANVRVSGLGLALGEGDGDGDAVGVGFFLIVDTVKAAVARCTSAPWA